MKKIGKESSIRVSTPLVVGGIMVIFGKFSLGAGKFWYKWGLVLKGFALKSRGV